MSKELSNSAKIYWLQRVLQAVINLAGPDLLCPPISPLYPESLGHEVEQVMKLKVTRKKRVSNV